MSAAKISASKFFRGANNVRQCMCCQRNYRVSRGSQQDGAGDGVCEDDFELAGIYNTLQDYGAEGVQQYAAEILRRAQRIVKLGGTLDGDVLELLAATGQAVPS